MAENLENKNALEESDVTAVPRIVYESSMARLEIAHQKHTEHLMDVIKKLWYAVILLIVLLVGTSVGWIIYEAQFEDVSVTQEVTQTTDQGGNNANTLNMGDYDGDAKSENDGQEASSQDGR